MWAGSPWADRPWADGPAASGGLPAIAGDLFAAESGADVVGIVGVLLVSGALAAVETGSDTASFREAVAAASSALRLNTETGRLMLFVGQSVIIEL